MSRASWRVLRELSLGSFIFATLQQLAEHMGWIASHFPGGLPAPLLDFMLLAIAVGLYVLRKEMLLALRQLRFGRREA